MAPCRSLAVRGGGLALLMSIMGCAHLGQSPSPPSTAGSTPRPPETAQTDQVPNGAANGDGAAASPSSSPRASPPGAGESAKANPVPGTNAKHDQAPNNPSAAKPRNNTVGTAKTPSPLKPDSGKGLPPAAAPPTLALSDIEQRLRDTHAIGVFTKLSLKNQIDDLLGQVRAYHLKPTAGSLPELRRRYDELLQKVIGLLQSGDPALAKDISSSREAIWSFLADSTTISRL